ncbi:MAG: hypothetical protein OHM56_12535 [Spiroplasma phoeniceum]|nr:MAG: hypothetical protein OHM57_11970 [Spiroplasma phoeniceum]UZQ32334.1 MAG: hypothetical protein OHM56_12535 [Spiroplasma phoeniceum]
MSENKNHKIESYYNHADAYPHLKQERKQYKNENEKITIENKKHKPPLTSLCEVISPLYGKKLDGADEFKVNMLHSYKQQKENSPITSTEYVISQRVSEKRAELANITEEKISSFDKNNIEPYFRKYNPVTNKEIMPSTLKTKNKLSEPTSQTVSFLLKQRKSGANIFDDRTSELKVELEQIKEKISNPMPQHSVDDYDKKAMFEGIEEQREINEQIRNAVVEAYHIDDNFSEYMPLQQRRRLIQHNSTKAGAVRFKMLLNLQENNLNNQFLRHPKPLSQNASGYHKKLHDLRNSDSEPDMNHVKEYHTNRNPYLSRMLEIEERTAKEAEAKRRERIKTQINDFQRDNENNNE